MEDTQITVDIIKAIIIAESLKYFVIKVWAFIDSKIKSPLDID